MTLSRLLRLAAALPLLALLPSCQEGPTAPAPSPDPTVSLSVDVQSIDEAGGVATVVASLSEPIPSATSVTVLLSGTAALGTDYAAPLTEITIPPGLTSGALTITAVDDVDDDDDETVVVTIGSVSGGIAAGVASATITIVDDDEGPGHVLFDFTSNRIGRVDRFDVRVLDESGVEGTFLTVTESGSGFTALVELPAGGKAFEVVAKFRNDVTLGSCTLQGRVRAGDTLTVAKGVCIDDQRELEEEDEDCQLLNGACNASEIRFIGFSLSRDFQALDDDWWRIVFPEVPASGEVVLRVTVSTRSNLEPVHVFRRPPGATTLESLVSLTDNNQLTLISDLVPGTELYVKFAPASTIDPCSSDVSYEFSLQSR